MVFQHSTLFDSMTCAENVALPLRKHRRLSPRDAADEARRRLEQVHMHEFADRYPPELGDGMRKRVAIARALTLDPKYVLFDEPTTSLDPVSVTTGRSTDPRALRSLGCDVGGGQPRSTASIKSPIGSSFSTKEGCASWVRRRSSGARRTASSTNSSTGAPAARSRRERGLRVSSAVACPWRRALGRPIPTPTHRSWPEGNAIEVKVGALILASLGILAAFVLVMGGLSFEKTFTVFVDFDNPGGGSIGRPRAGGWCEGRVGERARVPRRGR